MTRLACLIYFLSVFSLSAAEHYRIKALPFELEQIPSKEYIYFDIVNHLESDNDKLYIAGILNPHIVSTDHNGKILRIIGGVESGPGAFEMGVVGMAFFEGNIWAQDPDDPGVLKLFKEGKFVKSITVESVPLSLLGPTSNVFACNDKYVVLPCPPEKGCLALAYGDGEVRPVGKLIYGPDHELSKNIPAVNYTSWRYSRGNWYALFQFQPFMLVFDEKFEQIAKISIKSEHIDRRLNEINTFKPKRKNQHAPRLFHDFKITDQYVYAMCGGYLHCFDIKTGALSAVYSFYSAEPDLKEKPLLEFFPFTITPENKMFMVGAWGEHHFWRADLLGNP